MSLFKTSVPSLERTSSGNSGDISIGKYIEGNFYLNCTAASGTLDVIIEIKDTLANAYTTVGTFSQLTATGKELITIEREWGEKYRIRWTLSGTFTFSVGMIFK